ncbi:hypothetical protein NC652_004735 [Populus alba x Populus x berolinensis]|nr:hypothetical protein NC652_004735 [Populus alba x Populus x berolinensis]
MNKNQAWGLLVLEGPTSVKERGEKRAAEGSDLAKVVKKPREWLPSLDNTADELLHLSNLNENTGGSQEERVSPDQQVTMAATQDTYVSNCRFPRTVGEPGFNDPVLTHPSIMTMGKQAPQVDIDLSMSNSNVSGEYTRHMTDGKLVEIIDLENDTLEDKDFDSSQIKTEIAFNGTEGFPNHSQNVGNVTDVQDNYDGLMLSEFLNNFPNCNSVPGNINPLQNEMGLDNGEV